VAAETFFARWSRRKTEAAQAEAAEQRALAEVAAGPADEVQPAAGPTLEQVAALTSNDDFTPFVARGVDETVRRAAMKKLFSDPQFNVMDGLDTYIDDYNKFEPMTPAMVAALNHAKDLLNPLAAIERELAASVATLPPPRSAGPEDIPAVAAEAPQEMAPDEVPQTDTLQAPSQEADEHANQSL
jgi:hypothetical protein